MDYSDVRKEVARFCHFIYEKGYTQGSGGNVSCRVPGTRYFAIKKTGVNMKVMTEEDVLIVDEYGKLIHGEGKPSKEFGFHLGVLKIRPDMNAFIHCHPNYSIAFANNDLAFPLITVTARKAVGYVPLVDTALAGSDELRDYVIEAFRDNPDSHAILMKEHGVSIAGKTLEQAFNVLDIMEQTAKQAFLQAVISKNIDSFKRMV